MPNFHEACDPAEIEALARKVWGNPNAALTTRDELRFGTSGSKSVRPKLGVWFDHEAVEGGHYRDLYRLANGTYPENGSDKSGFQIPGGMLRQIGNPVAWWDYHDERGFVVARVVRFQPAGADKTFRQCRPEGDRWAWKMGGLQIPLYRLPSLLNAPAGSLVYITEGEKHADRLREWGLIATTNAGGAGKFRSQHASVLLGHTAIVVGDNDEAGRKHVATTMGVLKQAGVKAHALALPGLPEKGDVIDWIEAGGTVEQLQTLTESLVAESLNAKAVEEPEEVIDPEAEIALLAQMPMLRYAQRRAHSAAALGITMGMLDRLVALERGDKRSDAQGEPLEFPDPESWEQPVDGFQLICDMRVLLLHHIVLPPGAGWAVAVWCLHTFLLGITEHTPRLAVVSPEKGCGKTTLLDLLGRLVFRPLLAANLTPAATFRVIARHRPCLLIDEADTFLRDNEELRGVLNAGHRYDGFVLRTVGEDMEPRRFSVFGPVAIALIGNLPGTLADRSITVRMRRAGTTDSVEPIRKPTHAAAAELVRKAHRWAGEHRDKLVEAEPTLPATMWNRVADNWRPLFAIAEAIGGEMPKKLTEAAETLLAQGAADPQSLGIMLLQDIREVFRARNVDRMPSMDLVRDLVAMDERPWASLGKVNKPITPVRMADMLRQFMILRGPVRDGADVFKGYLKKQFEDAWSRYLEPEKGV